MVTEVSAGGVVYTNDGVQPLVLLILDIYGRWTLPKGHLDPGETPEQAALREIEEEVGLKVSLEHDLGETRYQFRHDSHVIDKIVHYYLARATEMALRLAPGEVQAAQWVPVDRVLGISDYANNRPVLEKAITLLAMQQS